MRTIILFSVFILAACQGQNSTNQDSTNGIFETVTKDDFSKKMQEKKDHLLVDVRTPSEYSAGTINNAVNIDWNNSNFETEISKLDKNKPIFIFCQKGGRSGKALKKMKGLGFQEVYDLQGGYGGWNK